MMKPILRADDFLLDRVYQPVVDRFSRWWGIGFIAVGEFVITGAVLAWFGNIGIQISDTYHFIDAPWMGGSLDAMMVLGGLLIAFSATSAVHMTKKYYRPGHYNPMRYGLFGQRFGNALIIPLFALPGILPLPDILHVIRYACGVSYILLVVCAFYFLSCQEGPPKRVRQKTPPLALGSTT